MPTLGTIKQDVAVQLGKSDYSVSVERRDVAINAARDRYYREYDWSWAQKVASLAFSGGAVSAPSDFQESRGTPEVYSYSGDEKTSYTRVALSDVGMYGLDDYVWSFDVNANAIVSNQPDATVSVSYLAVPDRAPLDTSADASVEMAPDVTAIVALSVALYWLNSERDDQMMEYWMREYKDLLKRDINLDKRGANPQASQVTSWSRNRAIAAINGRSRSLFS